MAVIEAPLCFFEVEQKGVFGDAPELGDPDLGEAPESFDAVDVRRASGELVFGVVNAEVTIADVNGAVIALPAIGVDDCLHGDLSPG